MSSWRLLNGILRLRETCNAAMNWPWFLKPVVASFNDIPVGWSMWVTLALSCGLATIFAAIGLSGGGVVPVVAPLVDGVVVGLPDPCVDGVVGLPVGGGVGGRWANAGAAVRQAAATNPTNSFGSRIGTSAPRQRKARTTPKVGKSPQPRLLLGTCRHILGVTLTLTGLMGSLLKVRNSHRVENRALASTM